MPLPLIAELLGKMFKAAGDAVKGLVRRHHFRDLNGAALLALRTFDVNSAVDGCTSAVASITEGTLAVGNNYIVFNNAPWHECYPAVHLYNTAPNVAQLEDQGFGIFRKVNHTTAYVGGLDPDGDIISPLHAFLEIPPTQRRRLLASRDGTQPDYSNFNIVVDTEFAEYLTK